MDVDDFQRWALMLVTISNVMLWAAFAHHIYRKDRKRGDDAQTVNMEGLCFAEDPVTCDHGHITLSKTDPILGALAEVIERHGIKRGGIQYDVGLD